MSKYVRPAVHAAYVLAGFAVLFATTDAGRSFVENHPSLVGVLAIVSAALRAAEQLKANRA
jgi:hypothetical protein